jgi:hypothetical protein
MTTRHPAVAQFMSLLLTPVALLLGAYFMMWLVPAILLLVPSLLIFCVVAGLAVLARGMSHAISGWRTLSTERRLASVSPAWSTPGALGASTAWRSASPAA